MKKLKAMILILACVVGLCACGKSDDKLTDTEKLTYQSLANYYASIMTMGLSDEDKEAVRGYSDREWKDLEDSFASYYGLYIKGKVFLSGLESWWNSESEIGDASLSQDVAAYKVTKNKEEITVIIPVTGTKHDAQIEIMFDSSMNIISATANVSYSFGEKMAKAGLNTLLGMGTVFIVLILICFIISCFSLIPKIQNAFSKKPSGVEVAAEHTIAQIEQREEEELADDLELAAVIAAAVAAYEGGESTDGFVVRSIRRVGRKA